MADFISGCIQGGFGRNGGCEKVNLGDESLRKWVKSGKLGSDVFGVFLRKGAVG